MKLTVTQENLSKALQVVGRVATSKAPLPILNNILIKTSKNRLLLAATNLEIAITQYIGSKIEVEGAITVPARLMSEFIINLPKGNVALEVEGSKLHIESNGYKSTINGMSPDEFPALPEITEGSRLALPVTLLKRAIQQTILAASNDDTRPVLTGVYCHTHDGGLYFAATDGYRLAERRLEATEQTIGAIIPTQTLQDVLRVVNDDMSEVKMVLDENQVRFQLDTIEITSRLIDGTFPDYRQLIPATSDSNCALDKDEFTRITKIASLFARASGGSVTLNAKADEGKLTIHSVATQLGENTSETSAEIDGDGQVTLNSRYLLEALSCIDDPRVSFSFSGKISPCIVRSAVSDGYKHIIMPLKS